MNEKLIECVPNISEGRNPDVVKACADAVSSVPGIRLMNVTSDADHNRSVLTFIGSPESVTEAAVRLCKQAVKSIDLTRHHGEHPRMGAVDVIPFIPVRNAEMDDAVAVARTAGKRIAEEAGVPVYLYEKAATAEHRRNLADVRRGQFEGLPEKTKLPGWQPDFGSGYHPTAGISIVGAREFLIAYNLELSTSDVSIAKEIAKAIRESSGGLPCVKALGMMLHETNTAQVSVNLTDFRVTPLYRVVEAVRAEAEKRGVTVTNTELIGMSPMKALIESAAYYLKIRDFDYDTQVLENYLL